MRRTLILFVALICCSCLNLDNGNPYSDDLHLLTVQLQAPDDYSDISLGGITIVLNDNSTGSSFKATSDANGLISIEVPNGVYSATLSATIDYEIFNGSKRGIIVDGKSTEVSVGLIHSKTGDIVIKEIYCGGCMKLPLQGTYNVDSYVTIHNNSNKIQYLDGLCFGTLDPYNSNSQSVWDEEIDFTPIIQAVWQFPGDGTSHPLAPGEDAVIVIYGAIDHSAMYPLSVNLNKPDYYVCYNELSFWNTSYHPAPGNNIRKDHILDVVVKVGKANAYTFSTNSPAVVIFRSEGQTMKEFVSESANVLQKPGSDDRIIRLPNEWVVDGVEVYNGQATNNKKRMNASIDAGSVTLSNTHESKTLVRKVNEEKSAAVGFEVLTDTNNSSQDFYESQKQLLNE